MAVKVKKLKKSKRISSGFSILYKNIFQKLSRLKRTVATLSKKRLIIIAAFIVMILFFAVFVSQLWLVKSTFFQASTFSKVSILGTDFGNLDSVQLEAKLVKLKSQFESQTITLINGDSKWTFKPSDLGVTFEIKSTEADIFKLNKLNIVDKFKLVSSGQASHIIPEISIDNSKCVSALSIIPTTQIAPKDASYYYDQGFKITPDQPGSGFNPTVSCRNLTKDLIDQKATIDISLDVTPANITKTDLEANLSRLQDLIGSDLTFKNGSYQKVLAPDKLFAMIAVSKVGSEIKFDWVQSKIDEAVNDIAAAVNKSGDSPSLGACQYTVSNGGYALDKAATGNVFTNLSKDSARIYNLKIDYYNSVVKTISPVSGGSSGVVYLTFDDGLTYGNQIMNYAACYGVKVTFFELGSRVDTDAAALRRAVAEGHAVQSHGFEHAIYDYGSRSYDWQNNDIARSINEITRITGVRPTYFRPPGGNRSDNTYKAAAANGVKLILWGATSADTTGFGSSWICSQVLAGAFNGASILMHSTKSTTANAVPCIIEGLAAKGFSMQALR